MALPERGKPFLLFLRRIWGLMLRHIYLHIGSWPRIVEMMYWPLINMLSWGFTSLYVVKRLTGATILQDLLVGGVLLNEIFTRTSLTMLVLFLEEVWSRNLGHLFASPMKFSDYTVGLVITALTRMGLSVIPAMFVAKYLFGFSILSLGWPLVAFIGLLTLNGCWYGLLVMAMLFRYGLAAEWLGWMSIWLLTPLVAPYYPVSILPHAMQYISWSLPATYVFESMKSIMGGNGVHADYLWISLALNTLYLVLAGFVFRQAYRGALRRGGILQVGE
jgi:ABC-2 type transport system permease protein